MTGAMTELTLDVVGAALFGHQFGDLARKMKNAVTSGLRAAEVAARLLMVLAPPVWLMRAFAAASTTRRICRRRWTACSG